jgi:hypothetical protein
MSRAAAMPIVSVVFHRPAAGRTKSHSVLQDWKRNARGLIGKRPDRVIEQNTPITAGWPSGYCRGPV